MSFRIKGESKRTYYHSKWIDDNSGDGPFLMEYVEDGLYDFYDKYMELYEANVNYTMIADSLANKSWYLVENPNK